MSAMMSARVRGRAPVAWVRRGTWFMAAWYAQVPTLVFAGGKGVSENIDELNRSGGRADKD